MELRICLAASFPFLETFVPLDSSLLSDLGYITNQYWVDQGFRGHSILVQSCLYFISDLNSASFLKFLPSVSSSFFSGHKAVKLYYLMTPFSRGYFSTSRELDLLLLLFWKLLFKSVFSQMKFVYATLGTAPYLPCCTNSSPCGAGRILPMSTHPLLAQSGSIVPQSLI